MIRETVGLMPQADDLRETRREYDRKTAGLVGRSIVAVAYWDVHQFTTEPRTWDFGEWHLAVMGLELTTDSGSASVTWTDTFFPYGVEVIESPITDLLALGPEGPEGWAVESNPHWQARLNKPVQQATTFWEPITLGSAWPVRDGVDDEPTTYNVPVALRLDFHAGPVWMIAAIPQGLNGDDVHVPGDEIMIVFSADRMRRIGFPETTFTRPR
jgi:hypothetical protein